MKSFLLVDDDIIFLKLTEKIIEVMGIRGEIHSAQNGQVALKLIDNLVSRSQKLPDIILLDLNMPILNGFGFIEAFNQLDFPGKENMRIVVVSSSQNHQDISRVKAHGVKHYLIKPIEPGELLDAIQ